MSRGQQAPPASDSNLHRLYAKHPPSPPNGKQRQSGGSVGTTNQGKGRMYREVSIGWEI